MNHQERQAFSSVEHLFRHEAGHMIAVLTRVFGLKNLDLVEDVVQETLYSALEKWRFSGVPQNPAGWLYQVAKNKALDSLRRQSTFLHQISNQVLSLGTEERLQDLGEVFLEGEISDDVLRLMLACCDPVLGAEARICLILKYVCGFSDLEIASGLLVDETVIRKRLSRARAALDSSRFRLDSPLAEAGEAEMDSLHASLYLLFNEGYHSSHSEHALREDLCAEAMRLADILYRHPHGGRMETAALLAMMHFHAARLPSRLSDSSSLVLLKDQDRSLWDRELIARGFDLLKASGQGELLSRYHLEAALAAQHCLAPDFVSTDWKAILYLYDTLVRTHPSPIIELNRALVLAQIHGPDAGLEALGKIAHAEVLQDYPFYHASLGELTAEKGEHDLARHHFEKALILAVGEADKRLLKKKLARFLP
jgi:RNA polymerase sigma factor (sigma-70 family)